eukprot:3609314-Pleurochrysis_carterae.AAC.2
MNAVGAEVTQQAAIAIVHAVRATRIEARLIEVVRNTPGSNVKRSAPKVTAAVISRTFTMNETMGHPIPANARCGSTAARAGGKGVEARRIRCRLRTRRVSMEQKQRSPAESRWWSGVLRSCSPCRSVRRRR